MAVSPHIDSIVKIIKLVVSVISGYDSRKSSALSPESGPAVVINVLTASDIRTLATPQRYTILGSCGWLLLPGASMLFRLIVWGIKEWQAVSHCFSLKVFDFPLQEQLHFYISSMKMGSEELYTALPQIVI